VHRPDETLNVYFEAAAVIVTLVLLGQVFELKSDATGDEKDLACGKDWRTSTARSAVVVTPDAGRGTVGFSLSATGSARRGYWRTKATLSCTTINRTDAQAAAMARGQAWITLGGAPDDRYQLVVETTGADANEWALSVADTAGQKIAPTQVGSTLVAAVPGGGRYSVAASVTARAATAGSRDSVEQRARGSVKVSSFRNALAAYTGSSVSNLIGITSQLAAAGNTSQITFHVSAGTAYHIAVDGFAGASGNVVVNFALVSAVELDPASQPPDGSFQFMVIGLPGQVVHLEASPDLSHWTRIATVTNVLGTNNFVDSDATNFVMRFYRGVTGD
jgi:hypothetical protein